MDLVEDLVVHDVEVDLVTEAYATWTNWTHPLSSFARYYITVYSADILYERNRKKSYEFIKH